MAREQIRYRGGYKYQLADEYSVKVRVVPEQNIVTGPTNQFINLDTDGVLVIKGGYAWDGPSGPTIDTKNFMRGSLVHDALYQIMRLELLSKEQWRDEADFELKRICREDGMSRFRAWAVHRAVRRWADPAASPESRKKTHTAP